MARLLGITGERKEQIYLRLARSAALDEANYWLSILLAAGIATLGLVLNSPAVIIGAMLISPLMGPILSAGLALAAGDLVLGVRTGLNLLVSCAVAIGFAILLVAVLPFKEMTTEIAARTQPTTLDFVVALLSGLVGSIAICPDPREATTSLPGVAIAVALMPPLCVVGYGLGYAISLDAGQGLRVARGGGLLFLTNLIAITFTAMVVFLAVRLNTPEVRAKIQGGRRQDGESAWLESLFLRIPALHRASVIGSLPVRVATVLLSIALLLVPLSKSFGQLKQEIARQRLENRTLAVAKSVWQERFVRLPNGEPRSYIEHLAVKQHDGLTEIVLRVFTSEPCSDAEKELFTELVTQKLSRPAGSVVLQLIEIPTARAALKAKREGEAAAPPPPSVDQIGGTLVHRLATNLRGLRLPPEAEPLGFQVALRPGRPPALTLSYIADREIGSDAAELIAGEVQDRIGGDPPVSVALERNPRTLGPLTFSRRGAALSSETRRLLDLGGAALERWPQLRAEIGLPSSDGRVAGQERGKAVAQYLANRWRIEARRVTATTAPTRRTLDLTLRPSNSGW